MTTKVINNLTRITINLIQCFRKTKGHKKRTKEFENTKEVEEIVKTEDRQDHGQQNETKDKQITHNTTLKTKAGVKQTLPNQGELGASEG